MATRASYLDLFRGSQSTIRLYRAQVHADLQDMQDWPALLVLHEANEPYGVLFGLLRS